MDSGYVQVDKFASKGCFIGLKDITLVADYFFVWNKKNGWLIEGVHVGADYDLIE